MYFFFIIVLYYHFKILSLKLLNIIFQYEILKLLNYYGYY